MSLSNSKTDNFSQNRSYRDAFLTVNDLIEFKDQLISEIRNLLKERSVIQEKKWLKSTEVRKMLNISRGTLQNLRVNGRLPFTKIGGVIYYDFSDIQTMFESNKLR